MRMHVYVSISFSSSKFFHPHLILIFPHLFLFIFASTCLLLFHILGRCRRAWCEGEAFNSSARSCISEGPSVVIGFLGSSQIGALRWKDQSVSSYHQRINRDVQLYVSQMVWEYDNGIAFLSPLFPVLCEVSCLVECSHQSPWSRSAGFPGRLLGFSGRRKNCCLPRWEVFFLEKKGSLPRDLETFLVAESILLQPMDAPKQVIR